MSTSPSSGPVSGMAAPVLFRGEAGPGFWIRDHKASVEILFSDRALGASKVVRLSPTGAWFKPSGNCIYPTDAPVELSVHAEGHQVIGPIWGAIVKPPATATEPIFGLSFQGLPFPVARKVVTLLRDLAGRGAAELAHRPQRIREDLVEIGRIRAIVQALAASGSSGQISGHPEHHVTIRSLGEDGLVRWEGSAGWGGGPFVVELTGYNSVYRLHVAEVGRHGADPLVSPLPTRIERMRQRRERRVEVPKGTLTVSFVHPLWPRLPRVERDVEGVSFGGFHFGTSLDEDLLFPGLVLPVVELRGPRGLVFTMKAEIRSVGARGEGGVARLAISPQTQSEEARWHAYVGSLLYHTTQSAREMDASIGSRLWTLYHESGYFNLSGKTPEQFEKLRSRYVEMVEREAVAPRLFCNAVASSESGVEGTVSIMKVYSKSWMLHQLAKRQGSGARGNSRMILRDLYTRAFEHALTDRHCQWAFAYAEASVRWNQLSHFDFAERHAGSGLAMALPFLLMEAQVREPPSNVQPAAQIARASEEEVDLVLEHLRAKCSQVYVSTLDLTPAGFDLAHVSREWSQAGFLRKRAIFTAKGAGGGTVAAAIVECCETGANLFRLPDCLRLVVLVDGGEATLPALVDAARAWFAKNGKDAFVYFAEEHVPGLAETCHLRDLGAGRFWAISTELVPDFLEHLFEVTSPRRMSAVQADEAAPGRAKP